MLLRGSGLPYLRSNERPACIKNTECLNVYSAGKVGSLSTGILVFVAALLYGDIGSFVRPRVIFRGGRECYGEAYIMFTGTADLVGVDPSGDRLIK